MPKAWWRGKRSAVPLSLARQLVAARRDGEHVGLSATSNLMGCALTYQVTGRAGASEAAPGEVRVDRKVRARLVHGEMLHRRNAVRNAPRTAGLARPATYPKPRAHSRAGGPAKPLCDAAGGELRSDEGQWPTEGLVDPCPKARRRGWRSTSSCGDQAGLAPRGFDLLLGRAAQTSARALTKSRPFG